MEVSKILEKEIAKLRKDISKLEVLKITEEDPTELSKHIAKLEKCRKQYSKLVAGLELLPKPETFLSAMP